MTEPTEPSASDSPNDDSAWALPEQEPTNLIAIWPDAHAPTTTEVVTALDAALPGWVTVVEEFESDELDLTWAIAVQIEGVAERVVLWLDAAQPMAPDQQEQLSIERQPKWVIGAELLLGEGDPLTDFMKLVRHLTIAFPDVPAILDVNTARWYRRADLESLFNSDDVEPPVEVLWVIQAVQCDHEDDLPNGTTWLHTHGLWRCGVPELEMLEVPADSAECAAELMNDIAGLLLERTPPDPGVPFEIGTDLYVSLQPWQVVAPYVDENSPGGMQDRVGDGTDGDGAHVGVRAAICAALPEGRLRPIWMWPRSVVQRLMNDEAGVYMTKRATERQGRLARANWGQLATAFASWARTVAMLNGSSDQLKVVFGIKAGFATDNDASSREHLWFEVSRFEGERVEAELVNQPFSVSSLNRGDRRWIERAEVSDWLVMTPCGCFGPNDVPVLWQAIDVLKSKVEADHGA